MNENDFYGFFDQCLISKIVTTLLQKFKHDLPNGTAWHIEKTAERVIKYFPSKHVQRIRKNAIYGGLLLLKI